MSAMMGQPKPFASLSSGLLARKGQAKPAMRPQGFSGFGTVSEAIDDLGWNDMGGTTDMVPSAPAMPAPLPAPIPAPTRAITMPPVLHERAALREEIETPVAAPAPAKPQPKAPRAPMKTQRPAKAKAAFTLRLDADRHLRLRLASALSNRSAQQLVTEALDIFLQSLPDVEATAARLSQRADTDLADGG